jgi:hypothetical protein
MIHFNQLIVCILQAIDCLPKCRNAGKEGDDSVPRRLGNVGRYRGIVDVAQPKQSQSRIVMPAIGEEEGNLVQWQDATINEEPEEQTAMSRMSPEMRGCHQTQDIEESLECMGKP